MSKTAIQIYTDGACSGNPGPGGWGAYLIYGEHTKHISGYEIDTTNNRMELTAAIEGLKALKNRSVVELYTDSVYVQKGITEWIEKWIKNNWHKKHNEIVKNADLWQTLYSIAQMHDIKWHWVKGHANNVGNQIADQLAVEARNCAASIAKEKGK